MNSNINKDSNDADYPIIIGGYYRSGTTMLANILRNTSNTHHFIGVDLFLRTFVLDYKNFCPKNNKVLIANLLEKQQQHTVDKSVFLKLSDFAKKNTIDYIKNVPEQYDSAQSVKWLFNQLALENKKKCFAGKDNFVEIYYEKLVKKLGKLKLVILVRDPRSVISSNIYMGSFPKRNINHEGNLLWHLIGWIININTSIRLQNKYPDDVKIIKYEDLIDNKEKFGENISEFLNLKASNLDPLNFKFSFSSYRNKNRNEFYDNRKKFTEMLSKKEIEIIESFTKKEMNFLNYKKLSSTQNKFIFYSILINVLKKISIFSPSFSVFINNILFIKKYYLSWIRNKITYLLIAARIISPQVLRIEVLYNKGNPYGIINKDVK